VPPAGIALMEPVPPTGRPVVSVPVEGARSFHARGWPVVLGLWAMLVPVVTGAADVAPPITGPLDMIEPPVAGRLL
jgi:hypothetical protein